MRSRGVANAKGSCVLPCWQRTVWDARGSGDEAQCLSETLTMTLAHAMTQFVIAGAQTPTSELSARDGWVRREVLALYSCSAVRCP